jgi:hypothetical protein
VLSIKFECLDKLVPLGKHHHRFAIGEAQPAPDPSNQSHGFRSNRQARDSVRAPRGAFNAFCPDRHLAQDRIWTCSAIERVRPAVPGAF